MELMEIAFALAILLIVFGPKKLPELARGLGEIVNEFKRASSGISAASATEDTKEIRSALEDIAKKLDVKTEGKTIKQITREIITKIGS